MKFNYFFVSGGYEIDLICKREYNILCSYVNGDREINKIINNPAFTDKNKLFVDSGAYSIFKSGAKIDLNKYIEFINNSPRPDIFAQLDTIPGTDGLDASQCSIRNWENFVYMLERVNCKQKIIAVHHFGEPMELLKRYLEYEIDGKKIDYLCLAKNGQSNFKILKPYFDECFDVILNSNNKDVKVHGLGIADMNILSLYPFYSSDSSTHLQLGIRGAIFIPHYKGGYRDAINISSKANPDASQHYSRLSKHTLDRIKDLIKDKGYSWEQLQEDISERVKWNADFTMDLFDNYECQYKLHKNVALFEDTGLQEEVIDYERDINYNKINELSKEFTWLKKKDEDMKKVENNSLVDIPTSNDIFSQSVKSEENKIWLNALDNILEENKESKVDTSINTIEQKLNPMNTASLIEEKPKLEQAINNIEANTYINKQNDDREYLLDIIHNQKELINNLMSYIKILTKEIK